MTRLWPDGVTIEVLAGDDGQPAAFKWQGRLHPVATINQQWRIEEDWWREPVERDYYKLTTQTGLLVVIFRNLSNGAWYLQRLYD